MGRGTKVGLFAILAIMSSSAVASGDPLAPIWTLFDEGRDLSAVEQLRALAFRKDGSVANPLAEDMWEQLSPRLDGLAVAAPIERGDAGKPAAPDDIAAVRSAERRNAIDTIVDMAHDRRIVILNEEHDAPEDRAFGLAVAKALRPLGFTTLAAEAFSLYGGAWRRLAPARNGAVRLPGDRASSFGVPCAPDISPRSSAMSQAKPAGLSDCRSALARLSRPFRLSVST